MTLIERCRQVLTDDVIAEIVRKADAYFRERQPVAEWLDTSRDHLLAVLAPLLTEAEQEIAAAKKVASACRMLVAAQDKTHAHMTQLAVDAATTPLRENVESEREMNARLTAELQAAEAREAATREGKG